MYLQCSHSFMVAVESIITIRRECESLLSPTELGYLADASDPIYFLAKIWSAKRALQDALNKHQIGSNIAFNAITILRNAQGRPFFSFSEGILATLREKKVGYIHLSLADEKKFVFSYVCFSILMAK